LTRDHWFAALAALAYPADPAKAGLAFKPFLPWFSDLPDAAFTRAALEAVVTSPRKMAIPSYDEIRKPLAAWWRDNRPADVRLQSEYPRLAAPAPRGEPTAEEAAAVADLVRALKATTGAKRSAHLTPEAERPKPLPLPDTALLAEYERAANDANSSHGLRALAAIRARMLRDRLGIEA
jgi:hypothetical protein